MNFDFLPELETNILESDSVEKKLLRILHISPQELQIYSSKAVSFLIFVPRGKFQNF